MRVGASSNVLVVHRDRDAPFEAILLEHLLKVPEPVPVADDPSARRERGYPLLKEGQIGEHEAVRALHLRGELERDVLGGPEADVLDDEVYGGQVLVVLGDDDQGPAPR